jgi:GT2 family glycosyltransferase
MLTVVIITHDHDQQWPRLIKSLEGSVCSFEFCVHLLHNVPTGIEIATTLPLKVTTNRRPQGLSKNLNQMIAQIDTPLTLILNPDTELPPQCLQTLVDFQAKSGLSLVTCQAFDNFGAVLANVRYFQTPWQILWDRLGGERQRLSALQEIREGPLLPYWPQGSLWLLDSHWLKELAFDERFYLYCEDMDFCRRLIQAGGKIGMCLDTWYTHAFNRLSSRKLVWCLIHLRSLWTYYRIHGVRPVPEGKTRS